MLNDFRFAIRRLLKNPGFTISAVIVLALGIGVNTAVFDVVHTLIFASPPFSKPAELVQVFSKDKKNPDSYRGFSYPTYRDIRDGNSVFSDVLGWKISFVGLGRKGDTHRSVAAIVSSNYFSVLGVQMARGRAFLPEEEIPGRASSAAVVSYAYWQRNNLDPGVLGSDILVNGHTFTVVGIAPRGFNGTSQLASVSVWTPFSAYQLMNNSNEISGPPFGDRNGQELMIIARLKSGMSEDAARPQLEGIAANLEKAFPVEQKDQTFVTTPVPRLSVSTVPQNENDMGMLAPMLLGMSAVVLVVACLNLANMLLAQGMARRKEIAIRLAVGGNRRQIVRQLLIEGFALAFAGGAAGLILGVWSSGLLDASMKRLVPLDIVSMGSAHVPVILATLVFCVAATMIFALGPALRATRLTLASDLKEQASEDFRRRWRMIPGHPLIVIQLSLSLALLTATALFIRAADKAASVQTGLQPGSSLLMETDAGLAGYDRQKAQQLYLRLNRELLALPGVEHVASSATVPFGLLELSRNVQRAGLHPAPETKPATAAEGLAFNATWNSISADYFATVGLPTIRGRGFTFAESTSPDGPPLAIVDEILAKHLWPEGDALGQYIQYAKPDAHVADNDSGHIGVSNDLSGDAGSEQVMQIIGIVPQVRHSLFEKNPAGEIYIPFARGFQSNVSFFVRFRQFPQGSEVAAAELIRATLQQTDPVLTILSLRTFEQHLEANVQLWLVRVAAALFTVFGVLALGLAVVGLYGVKAYSVARRTREIGIRMALGARSLQVLRMFLLEGSITLFSGVALGLFLAVATGRIVSGLLYQTSPSDPIAFATASGLLALASLAATWLPAWRATRVDPLKALRRD